MTNRTEYLRAYREKQRKTPEYVANKQQRSLLQKEYRQKRKELFESLILIASQALVLAQEYGHTRLETMSLHALINAGKYND